MRSPTVAVIDVGSNTVRSLVVEVLPGGGHRVLDDERAVTRLASGLGRDGRLSHPAMQRAVDALRRMAEIARARGVRRAAAVATSAIRVARNRRTFLARVLKETGLRVRVISGPEEAQLAFESAALSFDLGDRPCAVADIGGGSTELILAIGSHIQHIYSLALGAVALTEEHLRSDPIKGREFKSLRRAVRARLEEAGVAADPRPQVLIGSGGTVTSLAHMLMAAEGMTGRSVQGYEMTQAQILHLREALLRRCLAERRQMPGLSSDRAEIIVAGATILYEILRHLQVNVLRVSERGIRHALLHRLIAPSRGAAGKPALQHRLDAALAFGRSLRFEEGHAEQVQRIALSFFDQLAGPLGLPASARDLLGAAAMLHDVGYVVSFRQHHKHSYHLIAHAQLDGFTPAEREIVALLARYHRRADPSKRHAPWASLPRRDRLLVAELSALLRIADALDRRHSRALREVRCRRVPGKVRFLLVADGDLSVERHAAEQKAPLFRETFGLEPAFELARARPSRVVLGRPRAVALRRRRLG